MFERFKKAVYEAEYRSDNEISGTLNYIIGGFIINVFITFCTVMTIFAAHDDVDRFPLYITLCITSVYAIFFGLYTWGCETKLLAKQHVSYDNMVAEHDDDMCIVAFYALVIIVLSPWTYIRLVFKLIKWIVTSFVMCLFYKLPKLLFGSPYKTKAEREVISEYNKLLAVSKPADRSIKKGNI